MFRQIAVNPRHLDAPPTAVRARLIAAVAALALVAGAVPVISAWSRPDPPMVPKETPPVAAAAPAASSSQPPDAAADDLVAAGLGTPDATSSAAAPDFAPTASRVNPAPIELALPAAADGIQTIPLVLVAAPEPVTEPAIPLAEIVPATEAVEGPDPTETPDPDVDAAPVDEAAGLEVVLATLPITTDEFVVGGVTWEGPLGPAAVLMRTMTEVGWGDWVALEPETGPDPDTAEATYAVGATEPFAAPHSVAIEIQIVARAGSVPSALAASLVAPILDEADPPPLVVDQPDPTQPGEDQLEWDPGATAGVDTGDFDTGGIEADPDPTDPRGSASSPSSGQTVGPSHATPLGPPLPDQVSPDPAQPDPASSTPAPPQTDPAPSPTIEPDPEPGSGTDGPTGDTVVDGSDQALATTVGYRTARASAALPAAPAALPEGPFVNLQPAINLRASWGANERMVRAKPTIFPSLQGAVIHHTETGNGYTKAQVPGIIRGIFEYHVRSNKWDDIGYNYLIDRFGTIWEGRAGGIAVNVQGAHAAPFNTGSFGVSVIGSYDSAPVPTEVMTSLKALLTWRFARADINSLNGKGAYGKPAVTKPRVVGHRDVNPTTCPGRYLYAKLPELRAYTTSPWTPPPVIGGGGAIVTAGTRVPITVSWRTPAGTLISGRVAIDRMTAGRWTQAAIVDVYKGNGRIDFPAYTITTTFRARAVAVTGPAGRGFSIDATVRNSTNTITVFVRDAKAPSIPHLGGQLQLKPKDPATFLIQWANPYAGKPAVMNLQARVGTTGNTWVTVRTFTVASATLVTVTPTGTTEYRAVAAAQSVPPGKPYPMSNKWLVTWYRGNPSV